MKKTGGRGQGAACRGKIKRRIAVVVLVSFFNLSSVFPIKIAFAQNSKEINGTITGCVNEKCYINLGSDKVKEGMEFDIQRKGKIIGKAKVVKVFKYSSAISVQLNDTSEKIESFDKVTGGKVPVEPLTKQETPSGFEEKIKETKKQEKKPDISHEEKKKDEIPKLEAQKPKMEKTKTEEEKIPMEGILTLAVVSIDNASKYKGKGLEQKVIQKLTEYLSTLKQNKYTLIERAEIYKAAKELSINLSGLVDMADAQAVGKWAAAKIILVGSIDSISILKSRGEAFVSISARAVEVVSGKVVFALSSIGSSGQIHTGISEETLIDKAIGKACEILVQKIPGEVLDISKDSIDISLGSEDGIKEKNTLVVKRFDSKTEKTVLMGKIIVKSVQQNISEGIFAPAQPWMTVAVKDTVYPDVKDDMLPKFKKKKNKTLWIVGIALVGAGFALLSKKGDKGTPPEPKIAAPPLPPN